MKTRLKELRTSNNISQVQISNILGLKQQQYSRYETGLRNMPLEKLIILADYYNTSIDYILYRDNGSISPIKICKKPLKKRTI